MAVSIPRLVHGISFLILLVSGAVICFFLLFPWVITGFIPNKSLFIFRRRCIYNINKLYFLYAVFLLEYYANIKIYVHGETAEFLADDNIFIISNHRTRIEWMFSAWVHAAYLQIYPFLVLVLKDELKQVPFYGWCMQVMVYMFLSRKRDNDLPHMRRCFEYYRQLQAVPSSMFIFPEGTDLHPGAIARSDAFAKEKQLPLWKHVLYPRPAGFQLCLQEVRRHGAVLHDITVAYQDHVPGKRTSEIDLLQGSFPRQVHIFVRRCPTTTIPEGDAQEREWLVGCFAAKEALLQSFYAATTHSPDAQAALPPSIRQMFPVTRHRQIARLRRQLLPVVLLCLCAWAEYVVLWCWLGRRWGAAACVGLVLVYAVVAPATTGGMDFWEMQQTQRVFRN